MKKLQLDLDTLAVESFSTDGGEAPRGTVAAHASSSREQACASTSCIHSSGHDPGMSWMRASFTWSTCLATHSSIV